ncbi:unnamed protein product [Lactuca virosa]|uniref:Uncharacterized protein n=1 Tax=Lactuca virosa TaxID=75947 RepID=A0AAU9MRP6_9ASTR|nr:unnamed protein product [Lactuca virosa]
MHLFHVDDITQDVYWDVYCRDYLRIDHQNTQLVSLSNPVHNTVWCLRSNLGVLMLELDSDSDEDEPIPNAPILDADAPMQQEPIMHPYHDMYKQKFQRLYDKNRSLHRDYSEVYDSAYEINT